jgi:filamentous hemagglutinin family protein
MKILRKLCSSMLLLGALTSHSYALPEGASVQAGAVNINTNGNTQTIQQMTDRAIVNWNGFNIDMGELVHIIQPGSVSAILNRVVGQDPSMILGALRANGQVFLINPNGVVFGHDAMVDVGSLVVSTLDITDQDFMQGRLEFEQQADKDLAAVINHGTIKIDENGYLVLTGPMVANDGVILAKVGQVALAAGTKTTVSFDPTGMIQLELPTDATSADGIVSLSHADAGDILSSVVNTPNVEAGQIVVRDGQTFLEVASGTVVNAGDIVAAGQAGEDGGRVILDSTSNTILADGSLISAAGVGEGSNGGEVYVLSDGAGVSELGSRIDVSDGGFAEQSSDSGYVGVQVDTGETGTFLIDPERIVVQTGAGGGVAPSGVVFRPEDAIEARVSGTELLQTEDGVDFEALNGGALVLQDGVNLTIDLTSAAGNNGPATTFANPSDVIGLGTTGAFTFTSVAGTDAQDLKVETDTGNIDIDLGGGALTGNSSLTTSNGTVTADVTGNLVLVSDNSEAIDALRLGTITADSINATGDDFIVSGTVNAATSLNITATNSIEDSPGLTRELIAPTVTLNAPEIGFDDRIEVSATNLNLTGEQIAVDEGSTLGFVMVNVTNLNAVDPSTRVTVAGEGAFIVDDGTELRSDAGPFNTYTFVGDRTLDDIDAPNLTLVTDGIIDGNIVAAGSLDFTAGEIDVTIDPFGFSPGITGTFTGVATDGNIAITDLSGNPLDLDLTATGSIGINDGETVAGGIGDLTGSADAPEVRLNGLALGTGAEAFMVGPSATRVELIFRDDAFVEANSPTLDLHSNPHSFTTDSLNFNNAGGDIVVQDGDYVFSYLDMVLSAAGSITTLGDAFIVSSTQGVNLTADSIDAYVASPPSIIANATNDIVLDLSAQFQLPTVSAISTGGDVTIVMPFGPPPPRGGGPVNTTRDVRTGQIEGNTISIDSSGAIIRVSGELVGTNVNLTSQTDEIVASITAENLDATAAGDISILSNGPNLNVTADTSGGEVAIGTTGGNLATGDISGFAVALNATTGDITRTSGVIDAGIAELDGNNITATIDGAFVVDATGTGDVFIEHIGAEGSEFIGVTAGNTASYTNPGNPGMPDVFVGVNKILDLGGPVDGALSASGFVDVTGSEVNLDVTASEVTATARTGDVTLTGTNANIGVSADSQNGNVDVNMNGNITQNAISGNTVDVTATGGDITQGTGRVAGTSVTLTGNNVGAQTATSDLTVNISPSGNANIDNDSASLDTSISTSGDVAVSNTGTLAGTYTANNLKLAGSSVDADISATTVEGDATNGNVALNSTDTTELTVTDSSATGDFTLNHNGDVVFDTINAQNVTINTTGNITDVANTIVASGITLNGNNILINTQGQVIVINAQGDVSVANTLVDVSSLTIDAQGNITFGTDGDLTIAQIAGGQLVSLTAGGNITAGSSSFVNGFNVEIFAGGSITPDLNNALLLGATNGILVQAQGEIIAGALEGTLPASAVTIQTPSGPIYYNGVLLNGLPEIPPIIDTTEVENQIGQTQGQVVDDGSVGSAANDGIVEESPTQELVAQLTEAAGGGDGGGSGPTTEVLITLEIDQLGEVQVELIQPSPFDEAIEENENMSADDVLDLDTDELTDVEVGLYYDPAKDQLIMAVNLSADDVLDLDVSDYVKIPVNVSYQFLGDPALLIENLRANDILDLEVEDLGEIPIKVHVSGHLSDND